MASLTRCTWVWISSGCWWWTGKPGVLQSMGSQRVRHDWATELNWLISTPSCSHPLQSHFFVNLCMLLFRCPILCTPWSATHLASLSFTISQSLLKLTSIESNVPFNHLILCHPLLSGPQSFTASGSFTISWFFASSGQSIGVSALVFPMNIQGWFLLRLTALFFLQSKGLSRVFSNTTVQKHQFFGAQLSL